MLMQSDIDTIGGMEFAIFKLKKGVSEEALIALSRKVENNFLIDQKELILHFLVRGLDGVYADIAMATTQQKAEEYCQQWLTDLNALEYLDLIDQESVKMTFWTRIN